MGKNFTKGITFQCTLALIFIVIFGVASYVIFSRGIAHTRANAAQSNTGSSLRMLSQHAAIYSLRLMNSQNKSERKKCRQELLTIAKRIENSHHRLIHGNPGMNFSGKLSPHLQLIYFHPPILLDKQIRDYIAEINALAYDTDSRLIRSNPHFRSILTASTSRLLESLNTVIKEYEKESEAGSTYLYRGGIGVLCFILFTLCMEVLFVFRPIVFRFLRVKNGKGVMNNLAGIQEDSTGQKRMEALVSEAGQKLHAIVHTSPLAIISMDTDRNISSWNMAAERIFGWTEQEVLGFPFPGIFSKMCEDLRILQDRVLQGGLFTGTEVYGIRRDGLPIDMSISMSPLYDGAGNINGIMSLIDDITERKRVVQRFNVRIEVARALAESATPHEAFSKAIQAICEGFTWDLGGIWIVDQQDTVLRCLDIWHLPSVEARKFEMAARETIFSPGVDLLGHVWVSGKSVWISDIIQDAYSLRSGITGEEKFQGAFCFPLKNKNEVLGVMVLFSCEMKQCDNDLLCMMADIGNQIGIGIERKQAEESIKEGAGVNSALLHVAKVIGTILNPDEVLRKIVEIVPRVSDIDRCGILLWDEKQNAFLPAQVWGIEKSLMLDFYQLKFQPGIPMIDLLLNGEIVVVNNAMENAILPKDLVKTFGSKSMIAIPIVSRDKVIGVIGVDRVGTSRPFKEREKIFLQGISHQLAIAIDNARLYREVVDRSIELSQKVETIKIMHEIERSILSALESDEILETSTRMVSKLIPSDRVTIAMIDKEMNAFVYKAGFGIKLTKGSSIPFEDTSATDIIKTRRPTFISDMAIKEKLLPLEEALLYEGYRSQIRVPLIVKDEIIGLLNVGSKRVAAFTPEHLSIIERIADQIAVALENARLVLDLKEMLFGAVKTLSAAIDAKSPWTAGHSERVTKYAVAIGRELGLFENMLKNLELAGLLHDIGKIGTYEIILDKPGGLTDEELKIMREHPSKGVEILVPIKHLREIIPVVKHHHESYDGTGYPEGLKGETIPFLSRILTVADAIDAMGEDRPYRNKKPRDDIVKELKRCSGKQFDPKVIDAFLKVVQKLE
ncbi:MAG: HDIG domain-containing protein [Candidatus Jettenia sp.]|nr:GAF domain-containing protein [Candidatus Jettenia sp. AMX1]MBC6928131.1 HDIG domain-containing protein [Candidatus Jettenia sp.]WKZ14483.1 MAG: GAF domain-containing protein [Candidatus Jettenia caeni]KAA0249459.1 MAG: GAF domain-containing protein [Candidatus Jettenia sp. AMX1]MDL1938005.1 GAF domain-containing protein [Candidatus Jettenia sp. AMX1]GIL19450.1 MAG: hypothetical protein BroJett041_05640 [Candidatus Jettenia caeni]